MQKDPIFKIMAKNFFIHDVFFENLLFGFIELNKSEIDIFQNIIKEYEKSRNFESFLLRTETKDFLGRLIGIKEKKKSSESSESSEPSKSSKSSEPSDTVDDYPLEDFVNCKKYIFSNDRISSSKRSRASRELNNFTSKGDKKKWTDKYNCDNIDSYTNLLTTVLKYFSIMYHQEELDDNRKEVTFRSEVWQEISQKLILSTNETSFNLDNFHSLADSISKFLLRILRNEYYSPLTSQCTFFQTNVEVLGERNINYYFALKKYCDSNVFCAYKLGEIYYYGQTFISDHGENTIEVKKNYTKAFECYNKCTEEPLLVPSACWSAGFIVLDKKISLTDNNGDIVTDDNVYIDKAEEYFKKCGDFAPALNSLGEIYRRKAVAIIGLDVKNPINKFRNLSCKKQNEYLDLYLSFLEKTQKASEKKWIYANNKLYSFYYDEKYAFVREKLAQKRPDRYKEIDPVLFLGMSADEKDPWAMDRLACHKICDFIYEKGHKNWDKREIFDKVYSGDLTLSDVITSNRGYNDQRIKCAEELLSESHNTSLYNRSTFHLAQNFHKGRELYVYYLDLAAKNGNDYAKKHLNKILKIKP